MRSATCLIADVHVGLGNHSFPFVHVPQKGAAGMRSGTDWAMVEVIATDCVGVSSGAVCGAPRSDAHSYKFFAIDMDAGMFTGFPACETRLRTHVVQGTILDRDGGMAAVFLVPATGAGRLRNEASREERLCRYVIWFFAALSRCSRLFANDWCTAGVATFKHAVLLRSWIFIGAL